VSHTRGRKIGALWRLESMEKWKIESKVKSRMASNWAEAKGSGLGLNPVREGDTAAGVRIPRRKRGREKEERRGEGSCRARL